MSLIAAERFVHIFPLAQQLLGAVGPAASIQTHLIDPEPTVNPSAIQVVVQAWQRGDNRSVGAAKVFLRGYFPCFISINEPTPPDLDGLLSRIDSWARFAPLQPMFYGQWEGIHQFAVYRPWDVLFPNEVSATIVFYEIPRRWGGSRRVAVAAGTGALLVKAGLLKE